MVIRKNSPQYKTIKVGGREMRVPVRTSGTSSQIGSNLQSWDVETPANHNQGGGCLCFFLGGFGPIGILIAAVIAKREGVVSALWGFLILWVVVIVAYFAFVGYLMR